MLYQRTNRQSRCSCVLTSGAVTLVLGLGITDQAHGQCEAEQTAKLTADDGAADDRFGYSVCVSGDTVVIGADGDDDDGDSSGSAYVFERQDGVWTQTAKLTADDGAEGDRFGRSVSVSRDIAGIAAFYDNDNGEHSGSAYTFALGSVDLDGSGAVDFGDILRILTAWGPCEGDCPEDLDESGAVDFGDILAVLTAWGPCE